ncbi:hypothetical protein ACFOKF_04965 [Sphingobium rhizovicinum]|uniref:Uncharacterized protein n=1 Tax=Sphingobium rhizovicinum TaxID=432308 RepID=A0ABV7NDM4_9SPHN
MTWTTIRLELARTPAFPNGSAARSYVLRLPLEPDGRIDEQEYRHHPEYATVRRFWPNEPDRHGHLLRTAEGWACSYPPDQAPFRLETAEIRSGSRLILTQADGENLPFEVKALAA